MPEQFRGTINVDIRDSEPDWTPFEPPKAPEGAPNVVYIVLGAGGFSALSCYGGPTPSPPIDRLAPDGVPSRQGHPTQRWPPARSRLPSGGRQSRHQMA